MDDVEGWDARQQQAPPSAGAGTADFDDGFASLDDLLGLDDSASPRSPQATGGVDSTDVDIDPFGVSLDPTPVITDSLDDLLSDLRPPPTAAPVAATQVAGTRGANAAPAVGGGPAGVSDSWLDDLLDLDNDDVKISSPLPGSSSSSSPSSSASGILESLIDDVTVERDGPRAAAAAAGAAAGAASTATGGTPPSSPTPSTPAGAVADSAVDTTAALDDWLNELLDDSSNQGSALDQTADTSSATTAPAAAASLEDDPWNFAAAEDGGGSEDGVGGSYGDVITGSNQLEGWKTNTAATSSGALKRSNIMGRARGSGSNAAGGERSRPWEQDNNGDWGEEQQQLRRESDWGAGEAWTDDDGGSSASWWDKDGPGMGMEEATGRRRGFDAFDAPPKKERVLDPIEEAQRACTADLKKLGQRGEWEDATRALVGARVRGVPINAFMYNRYFLLLF